MKITFAVIIVMILTAGGIYFRNEQMHKESMRSVLRVSMFWKKKIDVLDPAHISYANEAIILDNLYGNLVTYDNSGQLIADLADQFFWDGQAYNFTFAGSKKSSKGQLLTAIDAELTLKRLIILNKNTHGKLQQYLCGDQKLEKLEDECSGIKVEGNTLKLLPASGIAHDLLLSLLTGIDYKIIPAQAFEKNLPFKIIDYGNTSGPYYLDSKSSDLNLEFRTNPYSHLYSRDIPQIWRIIPRDIFEDVSSLKGDIDLITTASYIKFDALEFVKKDVEVFSTLSISNDLLVFSDHVKNRLDKSERAYVVQSIRNFLSSGLEKNKTPTHQFFPEDSVGYLTPTQETEIKKTLSNLKLPSKKVKIGFPQSIISSLGDIGQLKNDNIEIVPFELHDFSNSPETVDAIFVSTDSSFQEDISLLEYNFSFGIFGSDKKDFEKWMKEYISLERVQRIEKLKLLHFKILNDITIAPLFVMPYYAASTKNWKFEMSKLNASTQIWKIKSNNSIF